MFPNSGFRRASSQWRGWHFTKEYTINTFVEGIFLCLNIKKQRCNLYSESIILNFFYVTDTMRLFLKASNSFH